MPHLRGISLEAISVQLWQSVPFVNPWTGPVPVPGGCTDRVDPILPPLRLGADGRDYGEHCRREISIEKRAAVLVLREAGLSWRYVAPSTGVKLETDKKMVKREKA